MATKNDKNDETIIDASINEKEDKNTNKIQDKKEKNKNKKPNKFLSTLKDLGLSLFKTENLFKFGHKNCITPILIFLVLILYIVLSPYMFINKLTADQIIQQSNLKYVDEAMVELFKEDLHCSISNGKLACDDSIVKGSTENRFNKLIEVNHKFKNGQIETITYDTYVNFEDLSKFRDDANTKYFEVTLNQKPGDNYLVFQKDSIIIRYVIREEDKTPHIFKGVLLYQNLNDINFHQIYQNSLIKNESNLIDNAKQQEYLINQTHQIIEKGFKDVLSQGTLVQSVYNIISISLLILMAAFLFKGSYIFKKNIGFKYSQCLKITLVASLQAFLIGVIFSIAGFDIMKIFGLLFVIRIIYLWARYTSSSKNHEWFKQIYQETKDPRFNPNKLS